MGRTDSSGNRKRKREFAGLSLDKFAAARQSQAHKQKEKQRKTNAKTVNQYKKLVGRLKKEGKISEGEERQEQESEIDFDRDVVGLNKEDEMDGLGKSSSRGGEKMSEKIPKKRAKKDDDIVRLDESNRPGREAKQKAKEDAEQKRIKKMEEAEKAAKHRKQERSKFRRTNARGQPLMKFQIEKFLERLENERSRK